MKAFIENIYAFCSLPVVQVVLSIMLIGFGVHILYHTYKVFKQPALDLYDKNNLQCIAFALSSAIDEYHVNFSDEELFCNEHYVKLCVLHREICKMLEEDPEGRKLICSK